MRPTKIAPSILAADFARLGDQAREAELAGADYLHVDVMDGRFVPNISFGIPIVEALRRSTSLPLDVHLMIVEPERYIDAFAAAGAGILTVHAEVSPHLHRTVEGIRGAGMRPGVAINPATPLAALDEIAGDVDRLLLMSVNPGFGGQRFIERVLDKVRRLRASLGDRDVEIELDGGVGPANAREITLAGGDVLVAGSSVYADPDGVAAAVRKIREAAG
jgi:ribulose-phosphate 3-epimerase